jgi:hypothetical protein
LVNKGISIPEIYNYKAGLKILRGFFITRADVIIVDGDPLQNIPYIHEVTTEIKDANNYNPVQIHLLAGFQ